MIAGAFTHPDTAYLKAYAALLRRQMLGRCIGVGGPRYDDHLHARPGSTRLRRFDGALALRLGRRTRRTWATETGGPLLITTGSLATARRPASCKREAPLGACVNGQTGPQGGDAAGFSALPTAGTPAVPHHGGTVGGGAAGTPASRTAPRNLRAPWCAFYGSEGPAPAA